MCSQPLDCTFDFGLPPPPTDRVAGPFLVWFISIQLNSDLEVQKKCVDCEGVVTSY
ncbi:unnamed protein product [Brassica oleracea]